MLFISDTLVAELLSPQDARTIVLDALRAHADGQSRLSDPRSQYLRSPEHGSRFHLKGASLTGAAIAGFRIGGSPRAGLDHSGTQMMVLSDLETAVPLALIAGDALNAIRVGTAIAVTIEALRSETAATLALLGTGRLARAALLAVQAITPFRDIKVVCRTVEGGRRFRDDMAAAGVTGLELAGTPRRACSTADVILALTTANEPLIEAGWCRPGSLLVPAGGGRECQEQAILGADKLFVDDWEQCTILGDLAALRRDGKIGEADVTGTLPHVIARHVPGRQSKDERIVAIPQGLTVLDVALAHWIYRTAVLTGRGVRLDWP